MSKSTSQVDILTLIKELKDSDFNEIKLKMGSVTLELSRNVQKESTIEPEKYTAPEIEEEIFQEEEKSILERCKERDQDLLEELPLMSDAAVDLEEAGIVEIMSDGSYRYTGEFNV